MSPLRLSPRLVVAGTLTAIVLAAGSTAALATANGAFRGQVITPTVAGAGARCAAPTLAGTVIDVTLADLGGMGGMMGGQGQDGTSAMMGGGLRGMGVARVVAIPGVAPAGMVSLRVVNQGVRTHELVVLPLPAGQAAGTRPVGTDGRVDEAGSPGEASHSCGAGAGDGIAAGAAGRVTLILGSGRYELVCNLPGHYAAGMYAELVVR